MKSGKQRRLEIKEKRLKKAEINAGMIDISNINDMPKGALLVNQARRAYHYFDFIPQFYIDIAYNCRDCQSAEIWTAKQQKWWFEIAQGHNDSFAVQCRRCRKIIKDQKAEQKAHMEAMAQREPHPNEAFFKR